MNKKISPEKEVLFFAGRKTFNGKYKNKKIRLGFLFFSILAFLVATFSTSQAMSKADCEKWCDTNYSYDASVLANCKSGCKDDSSQNSNPSTTGGTGGALSYTPMENIPGFEGVGGDFAAYMKAIYRFGIWTVGICAVLMIMIGGFMYITSAGNNSQMGKAKGIITDALVGVILALVSYVLLFTINPELVKINNLSPVGTGGSGTSGGTSGTSANCDNLNAELNAELGNADHGVPPALLAAFMQRECAPAMSNPKACGTNNAAGAGGAMQFLDGTFKDYGCAGSKFNRQDALTCAAKKISKDSGGDYSETGIRKAAARYQGNCSGGYCDGIVNNYNTYKNHCT